MFKHLFIIACLTMFSRQVECQGSFNFPDNPQPTPEDSSDVLPGLEGVYLSFACQRSFLILKMSIGRQAATVLPTFPSLVASVTPVATAAVTPAVPNIVTPVGQTCICVPTGTCNITGGGSPGGEGLIDLRIVTNVSYVIHVTIHLSYVKS